MRAKREPARRLVWRGQTLERSDAPQTQNRRKMRNLPALDGTKKKWALARIKRRRLRFSLWFCGISPEFRVRHGPSLQEDRRGRRCAQGRFRRREPRFFPGAKVF